MTLYETRWREGEKYWVSDKDSTFNGKPAMLGFESPLAAECHQPRVSERSEVATSITKTSVNVMRGWATPPHSTLCRSRSSRADCAEISGRLSQASLEVPFLYIIIPVKCTTIIAASTEEVADHASRSTGLNGLCFRNNSIIKCV
jgi:hypothetical protein